MATPEPPDLARMIGERLRALGWRIALLETGSGGALTDRLSDIPGSSAYLVGALVAGNLERLGEWLGPAAGDRPLIPSRPDLAYRAAVWIQAELQVDLGLALVARPAPTGDGTTLADIFVAGPDGGRGWRLAAGGTPAERQDSLVTSALELLHDFIRPWPEVPPSPH